MDQPHTKTGNNRPSLLRHMGFWAIVAYGVGDILGAGIYALIGKIAGIAGHYCWIAFGIAFITASFTALSYAELGSRFPRSGGEATFCLEGFKRPWISFLVGWLVLFSGIVSMATISRAFAGYLSPMIPGVPIPVIIIAFLLLLTVINFAGIRHSSSANILCTLIEVSGLLIIVAIGINTLMHHGGLALAPSTGEKISPILMLQAGALAFFAFIGFEDMVNVSEEVKNPETSIPAAIITSLGLASLLYIAVAIISVNVVDPKHLAASKAPLLEVVRVGAPSFPLSLFTIIALFAVSNTSLLNFITGSRLIYGMADQGLLPRQLAKIHPSTRTPYVAILLVLAVTLGLALSGTLTFLAGTTSTLLLLVFIAVNASLLLIKKQGRKGGKFHVPALVPILGFLSCAGLIAFVPPHSLVTASGVAGVGIVLWLINKGRANYS